ncbi:MAG: ATP-binding protein [Flavobacterium sp.]
MSKLKEIFALVRSINEDEFQEALTEGESLDELHSELLFLSKKLESRKKRTNLIIEHISNCYAGDFFSMLPISEEEDELDVVCMGFNTYMEELKSVMVSKELLEEKNQKLLEEKNRSEQLAKAKDDFMSSMSHEIRTPLNGILGFTNILLENTATDTESLKQLNYIKTLGDSLMVIVNDILDLASIESGQISIEEKPFNLPIITKLVYNTFSIKAAEKEVDFSVLVDSNIPADFIGDPNRISQILYNLVSNAIKFTHAKGKVGLRICLDKKKNDNYFVKMIVKDTGIGIANNKLASIYDPFVQVSNDEARQLGGTGLGLSIVKRIVSMMKGEITVESELGFGTTFTVTIPLKESLSNSVKAKKANKNRDSKSFGDKKVKVLLAEDNRINQLLAQKILSGFKFEHVTVGNGREAVEAVEKEDFDVILMDLMMPEMNGYEAAVAIRDLEDRQKKNIPIIALTAVVVGSVAEKCAEVGIDKYLSKPFKSEELYEYIVDIVQP